MVRVDGSDITSGELDPVEESIVALGRKES
jgi:hypothetical protein